MAERAETDLLARALNGLSKNAQRDLALVFLGYESNTELLKTEIPQVWESLLEKYGSASSELGAQMFEQWAARIGIDSPEVKRVRAVDPGRARARLEWALSSKSPRENLMVLVDELVKQPARRTLAASADANGVKFARVPSGSETCAFCFMLASRGAVYLSEATAGKMDKFHGKCDCQIVPVRGPQDYPEGYHPDDMYDAYARARDKVAPGGQPIRVNEVLSQMRLDLHDKLRDGVEPPDVKAARLAKEAEEKPSEDTRAKPVGLSPADSDEWDQAVEAMKTSPEAHKKFFMKHLDHLREKVASAVDLSGDDWYLVAKDKGPDRILRNPESMEGVVRNPAPPAQEEALDAYLSPTYTQINGLLRGDKLSPEAGARARKWIRDLDSYFENNATHLAGDHVMVRGLRKSDLPEGELDRYVVGNTVVQKAYLSTASTESVASGFGGDVKLFIKAPDGQKYLSGVGFNNEAVFPRGMGLKVVAREDIPGLTTVYAELVDAR